MWQVEFLDDSVTADIEGWPLELKAALARILDRIEQVGLERMGPPMVSHLEGKLWEMRPSGKRLEGRALYVTAKGKRIIIVLAFIKKTQKTPRRVIEQALERAATVT